MPALEAFCELNAAGDRIEVFFSYDTEAVEAIRRVPGRRFVDKHKAAPRAPHWTIPLSLTSATRLREEFGQGLTLGKAVNAWGREEVRRQRNLGSLVTASDAELSNIADDAAAWLRPYQRADVKMMALTNVLNANQPGVGKTVEVIYAVQEAKLTGLHVVIAPVTLHKDPWTDELMDHARDGARVYTGSTPDERKQAMIEAIEDSAENPDDDIWLIINPDLIRLESDKKLIKDGFDAGLDDAAIATQIQEHFEGMPLLSKDHKGYAYYAKADCAPLFKVPLASLTLDEFHKHGLGEDRNTMYARAVETLGKNAARRFALSGTPMGGKPIRLWGVLYFIEPTLYGSKWRWAEEWLDIDDNGYGKKIGGITPGREDAFYEAHAKHMVRRTRKDALPGLPDKVIIDVKVPMTKTQRKAYNAFDADAEVILDGGRVSADGILAEYARLKQFANARCQVNDKGEIIPTKDSGKLPVLIERLNGFGCRKDNPEPKARAIVASESKRMVDMVAANLTVEGLNVKTLTGAVTGVHRDAVIDWYKDIKSTDEARVLVMTTQTGGVGLNLGMTGSIHILDETWNPDDQEQLEDRGMRDRTTPLMCLYYRTEDSIQEYIADVAEEKFGTNQSVLDTIRQIVAARKEELS